MNKVNALLKGVILVVFCYLLSMAATAFSNSGTALGQFTVANIAPPTATNWAPTLTHYKTQTFTWAEGTDENDDTITQYLCVSDGNEHDCDVVEVGNQDSPYTMTAALPNWDYAPFGTVNKTYYVNLTPFDGTENGTSLLLAFNLSDNIPTFQGAQSDAATDCDKDIGETVKFNLSSYTDADSDDNHTIVVCKTPSITSGGTCTGAEWCNSTTTLGGYSNVSDLYCEEVLDNGDEPNNEYGAYFFICDCPVNDTTCPGQCYNATVNNVTFFVNHAPTATPTISAPNNATNDTISCTTGFADNDEGDTDSSTYIWYSNDENAGTWAVIAGQTSSTLGPGNFDIGDVIVCEVTPLDDCSFPGTPVNSSNISIVNSVPNPVTSVELRDGNTNWDSLTVPDTHDQTPDLRWTTSDNDTSEDNQSIRTHVCISNRSNERDSGNCSAYNTITAYAAAGVVSVTSITGLDYNGTSVAYFARLTPEDNSSGTTGVNGTAYDFTFYLNNSMPVASALNTTATHINPPVLSWKVTDADNGDDGYWPADTLTHYVRIGNNSNVSAYNSSDDVDNSSYIIVTAFPWGLPGEEWANRTINFTAWATDGHKAADDGSNYSTSFVLYDHLPNVTSVQMVDTGSYGGECSVVPTSCSLDPSEGTNTTVAVTVNATDLDGDCSDSNHNAWLMLCLNSTAEENCDEENAGNVDFKWEIDSVSGSGNVCTFVFTTNKTASDQTPEFFRVPGLYKLHVNVSSQAGDRTMGGHGASANGTWNYGTLKAVNYTSSIILGDGSISLGKWNNGTNLYLMTNYGNDVLSLEWNASDPKMNSTEIWTLNGSSLAIDDDSNFEGDTGNLTLVYLNNTEKYFNHSTGLEVCSGYDCDDATLNETLNTFYHISPPRGLKAGTYNTTITMTLGEK